LRGQEDFLAAAREGVFFPCAHCEKYWAGVDLKLGRCAGMDCGSPIVGKAFEEYSGPLLKWDDCFICGGTAKFEIFTPGRRPVGICQEHLKLIEDIRGGQTEVQKTEGRIENNPIA